MIRSEFAMLGLILSLAGMLAVLIGIAVLSTGFIRSNPRTKKTGAIILVAGAVALLISFSLCSKYL